MANDSSQLLEAVLAGIAVFTPVLGAIVAVMAMENVLPWAVAAPACIAAVAVTVWALWTALSLE